MNRVEELNPRSCFFASEVTIYAIVAVTSDYGQLSLPDMR